VRTNKQTDKLTNWRTNRRRWKHPPRFATLRRWVISTTSSLIWPYLCPKKDVKLQPTNQTISTTICAMMVLQANVAFHVLTEARAQLSTCAHARTDTEEYSARNVSFR